MGPSGQTRVHDADFSGIVGEPQVALGKDGNIVDAGIGERLGELPGIEIAPYVVNTRHGMKVEVDGALGEWKSWHILCLLVLV
jgi:hypothetical protein